MASRIEEKIRSVQFSPTNSVLGADGKKESVSAEGEISIHEKVKQIANQISSFLKNANSIRVLRAPKKILLDEIKREMIKRGFLKNYDVLKTGEAAGKFFLVHKSSQTPIFSHSKCSDLVFKLLPEASAEQQVKASLRGREIIQDQQEPFYFSYIPRAMCIPLENKMALYVEERLPIAFPAEAQKELCYRLFNYLETEAIAEAQENFIYIIEEAATLAVKFDYPDVGHDHFPLIGWENGKLEIFCINFKQVKEGIIEGDKSGGQEALRRFARMFPLPVFIERFLQIADDFELLDDAFISDFRRAQEEGLKEYRIFLEEQI